MSQENAYFNKKISILTSAYNEEGNIERTVMRCVETLKNLRVNGEIIVTNDGSLDRTKDILEELKKKISNLVVVEHSVNQGYGSGLRDAFNASSGDLVVTMDSDGQFDIGDLPLLLDLYSKGHRVVTGFRKAKKDVFIKVLADRSFNKMVGIMFGIRLKDVNCALKLYDRELIKNIDIESRGFLIPAELMIKLKTYGNEIVEVGVSHVPRRKGKSSVRVIKTSMNFIALLFYFKLKQCLYRAKLLNTF